MGRVAERFEALKAQGRKAIVTYVVAGDPHVVFTVPILHAMVAAGADVLEVGFPFSDPMAEGSVIQLGHERVIQHGTEHARDPAKQDHETVVEPRTYPGGPR